MVCLGTSHPSLHPFFREHLRTAAVNTLRCSQNLINPQRLENLRPTRGLSTVRGRVLLPSSKPTFSELSKIPPIHFRCAWRSPIESSNRKQTQLANVGRNWNTRNRSGCLRQMSQSENKSDLHNTRPPPPLRTITPGLPNSQNDFLREQVKKQQSSNFHSSSLNKAVTTAAMVAQPQNVNRTALHPGGVQ